VVFFPFRQVKIRVDAGSPTRILRQGKTQMESRLPSSRESDFELSGHVPL